MTGLSRRFAVGRPRGGLLAFARIALMLGCLAVGLAGCATVDRNDLRSNVDEIHSDAAEGMLLAVQAVHHRAPTPFVWNHSAELHHAALEIRERISGEIDAREVDPYMPQTRRLINRVAGALLLLHQQPASARVQLKVRDQLSQAAAETSELADRI